MYNSRGRGGSKRGRGGGSSTSKAPLKGLFSEGIWRCNCDPRLPATHFQTKNGGKNHGRWFYTCQQPQPKRCDFFLWDDEAKRREAAAVLNNSRTEPFSAPAAPTTPTKPAYSASTGLATPQTGTGSKYKGWDADEVQKQYTSTPSKPASNGVTDGKGRETQATAGTTATDGTSDEEFYDWPASDEEALEKAADEAANIHSSTQKRMPPPPPETPHKAVKTDALSTPGTRRWEDREGGGEGVGYPTPATGEGDDDVFTMPRTTMKGGKRLFDEELGRAQAITETPTPIRYRDVANGQDDELAAEILATLAVHAVPLPADARDAVKGICQRHVLYTRGIMKGRDVSRAMVKTKDEKIGEMRAEMEGLKSERETNRAVIRHLRRDMAQRREATG